MPLLDSTIPFLPLLPLPSLSLSISPFLLPPIFVSFCLICDARVKNPGLHVWEEVGSRWAISPTTDTYFNSLEIIITSSLPSLASLHILSGSPPSSLPHVLPTLQLVKIWTGKFQLFFVVCNFFLWRSHRDLSQQVNNISVLYYIRKFICRFLLFTGITESKESGID